MFVFVVCIAMLFAGSGAIAYGSNASNTSATPHHLSDAATYVSDSNGQSSNAILPKDLPPLPKGLGAYESTNDSAWTPVNATDYTGAVANCPTPMEGNFYGIEGAYGGNGQLS